MQHVDVCVCVCLCVCVCVCVRVCIYCDCVLEAYISMIYWDLNFSQELICAKICPVLAA